MGENVPKERDEDRVNFHRSFDAASERFNAAWSRGESPEIRDFVNEVSVEDVEQLRKLAIQLVCIDLERRWSTVSLPSVATLPAQPLLEDYVGHLPELGTLASLPVEAIVAEFCARWRWGDRPSPFEYRKRFPEFGMRLLDHLFEAVPSSRSETATSLLEGVETATEDRRPPRSSPDVDPAVKLPPRYTVQRQVGRGGMGVVYRCRDERLDRDVAVKMMRPGFSLERFQREARLLARIRSPYVVRVFDFEVASDGQALIYLEWIDGEDLSSVIQHREEPIEEDTARCWMREVSEGMLAAAEIGIIHRDLKPSNILIDSNRRAHVADFGLASSTTSLDDLTGSGGILGTPYYMAPEQAEDPRRIDTRADIYSFGATFYHVLTSRPPFAGPTAFAVQYKHKVEPLLSPETLRPGLTQHTTELLERCLAKHPQERFFSFSELLEHLQPEPASHSPWERLDDVQLAPYLTRYTERRGAYLDTDSLTGIDDTYDLPNQRLLRIRRGNIALEEVDAIVSSDDEWLTMGGGVSHELAQRGGPAIIKEAERYGRVRPGRAVLTGAGKLKARFLLHGVTLGNASRLSRDLISEIVRSCFSHADTLYLRSLAFPLLGTGTGGFPRDVCLDTMFRAAIGMMLHGQTSVEEVRIVLYEQSSKVLRFRQAVEALGSGVPQTVCWGARRLKEFGPESVSHLVRLLGHSNAEVRLETIVLLEELSPDAATAIGALKPLLNDIDARVREAAQTAIERLSE